MSSSHNAAAPAPARNGLVVLALLLVYVVWGSTYLVIRFALAGGAQPLTMVSGARFIVAGTLLYAVLRWRGVAAPTPAQWKNVAFMGAALLLLGNGMVVLAERSVSSAWRRPRWHRCRCGWPCSARCAASTPAAANGWAS